MHSSAISFVRPAPLLHRFGFGHWGFNIALLLLSIVVLALLVVVKTHSLHGIFSQPFLFIYTSFVTVFQLSRIMAAWLYPRTISNILSRAHRAGGASFEPRVSFVIPAYNEETGIELTLAHCFAVDYPADKLEVIVINDGSTDRTGTILRRLKLEYPQFTFIDFSVNQGKRAAMVEGFRRATGEIIVQLDSDSFIKSTDLRALIRPFALPHIGAVCAHSDPSNAYENFITKIQAAYYFVSFRILKAAESTFSLVFCCSGCCSAYRREIIIPILDIWRHETFLGLPVTWGDDRGLTNWVMRLGYQTIYLHSVQAYTTVPNTFKKFIKQQVRWKKGWFVNSLFASRFIISREPFVACTYFFPLIFVTVTTPFMATRAFLYGPLVNGITPYYYILGVFLIALLLILYYRFVEREHAFWPYVIVWSVINMFVLSFLLIWALFRLKDRRWGTRGRINTRLI